MGAKTPEERLVALEQAKTDCQKNYDGKFKDMGKRVGRLEYLIISALVVGCATLLSIWLK